MSASTSSERLSTAFLILGASFIWKDTTSRRDEAALPWNCSEMPADKAPGPNGFIGFFLKNCWDIIKEDFYNLCFDFFNGSIDLESINNSFITLNPKTNNLQVSMISGLSLP
jgi:hypothetical protein